MGTPEPGIACADAREALEIAAVEPHGLERLAEGRTPADAAVVAHVLGCAECAAEASRLREIAALLREGLAPALDPALRERTLAYVAAVGRPRGDVATAPPVMAGSADAAAPIALAARAARPAGRRAARTRYVLAGLAMAAVVVLAVGVSAAVAGGVARSELAAERTRSAELARTADIAMSLLGDPSALRIPMAGVAGASGIAVISPASYRGAVVASGLPEAGAGDEYVCYVVIDGQRRLVGRMADAGSSYAWTGEIGTYAGVKPGSVTEYGVLLVPVGSAAVDGTPVISGSFPGGGYGSL
jgi:hypothetical protein